jgi:hypothetical protein
MLIKSLTDGSVLGQSRSLRYLLMPLKTIKPGDTSKLETVTTSNNADSRALSPHS